jgi:hypothetical protein
MTEPIIEGQDAVINAQSTPKKNFDAVMVEMTAAREISKQVKPTVTTLVEELNAQATKEDGTKGGTLDLKRWYIVRSKFNQPVLLAELKKTHPELVASLQQPIINKDDLVEGDDLAAQITDNSLINGVTIIHNPDAEDYLGLDVNMSTDSSHTDGQTVQISAFGDEGYTTISRVGRGHQVNGTPGFRYETRQNAAKITKMTQDVRSFVGTNIQQGNVVVSAGQSK